MRVDAPLLYGEIFCLEEYYPDAVEQIRRWRGADQEEVSVSQALRLMSLLSGREVTEAELPGQDLGGTISRETLSSSWIAYSIPLVKKWISTEIRCADPTAH